MAHEHEYGSLSRTVLKINGTVPLIIVGLVIMMIVTTVTESMHLHAPEALHEAWHHAKHGVHLSLWFFFLVMGAEIRLRDLMRSGKFVAGATLGGMIVPFLLTTLLLFSFADVPSHSVLPIAYGAMATDVPISVSLANMVTGGVDTVLVLLTQGTIMPLAVGDDLGGIAVMTAAYLGDVKLSTLALLLALLSTCFVIGERGQISFSYRIRPRDGSPAHTEHAEVLFHVDSLLLWGMLCVIATLLLADLGAEYMPGGCLVMIPAPNEVKDRVIHLFHPVLPLILFCFGLTAGEINVLDASAWGTVTAATFVGGHIGKMIGIVGFGLLVRSMLPHDSLYKRMPTGQIMALGILAAVNGTVAIIFVQMGMSATASIDGVVTPLISVEHGLQAKLGYFLTIFAGLVEVVVLQKLSPRPIRDFFFADSPYFQPAQDSPDEFTDPSA